MTIPTQARPTFKTSNCVALGVADRKAAAALYRDVLGFEQVGEGNNCIEMRTGALRVFLCEDEVKVACFELETEDVGAAKSYLEASGFVEIELAKGETFMTDPFGYIYCLSKAAGAL